MTTGNEQLYEDAKQAIDDLFSDTSVDLETAKHNLQRLRDEIDTMLDAIRHDQIAQQGG